MKRGRDMLTGGTGDVNPQLLTFTVTQSGADATTTLQVQLPIQRLPSGTRAQVLELLKVFIDFDSLPASASAAEVADRISVALSTASFGTTTTNFGEPRVFMMFKLFSRNAFTAGGTYYAYEPVSPFLRDMTDGAGHGIIIATDSIYAQISSAGTGATNAARIKLLYRWKDVPLQEYIGVVQSQQ